MNFTTPNIAYPFPSTGINPFFLNGDDNYFVFANGYSLTSNSLEDFTLDILRRNVSMGYKTLLVCQRIAIIFNDEIVKKWHFSQIESDDLAIGKFLIVSNKEFSEYIPGWKNYNKTYVFPRIKGSTFLGDRIWPEERNAINAAKQASNEEEVALLVSIVLQCEHWH